MSEKTRATFGQFGAIVSAMPLSDIDKSGKPKLKPLNKVLRAHGFEEVNAAGRDEYLAGVEALESESVMPSTVKIAANNTDPVRVTIGRETREFWVGHTYKDVPPAFVEALDNCAAIIEKG